MQSPKTSLLLIILFFCLASGCGLVADSLTGPGKSQPSPRQALEQKAGDALRDELLTAMGVDPQMLGDAQPLNRQETVSTGLPVAFTEVPGVLRFHNHAGFRLADFLRYMRTTYGVRLAVQRSTADELTGGRISALRQLQGGVEVFGAFYRAIGNEQDEITRATGHLYDGLEDVPTEATLSQAEAMAPLKAAYPTISNWLMAPSDTFRLDPVPAGTAVVYPGQLIILPQASHPEERNELTVSHRVVGLGNSSNDQVYLGANNPGLLKVATNIRTQSGFDQGFSPATATVNTRFYGERMIPTILIHNVSFGKQMDTVYKAAFAKATVPKSTTFYGLNTSWTNSYGKKEKPLNVTYHSTLAPYTKSIVGIIDLDNKWTNTQIRNKGYLDAAWSFQQTNDYYKLLGRNDFTTSADHLNVYFEKKSSYWEKSSKSIYLDEDGGKKIPDTDLHTIAHEYTHMVISRTADFMYEFEAGALNEAISDIMAVAIDDHLGLPGPKWAFDPLHQTNGLRNFKNPQLNQHPKMKGGKYWVKRTKGMKATEDNDEGGVHTNSSVVNHWCYLLNEGREGTNEKGLAYAIDPVDLQEIAALLYRALNLYMGPTSDFDHARIATIIAAEDIYGGCAEEVAAVTNAWYAVGVGDPYILCDDTWLSFYSTPDNGAKVSIYLDQEMEVTVVENNYKTTKVINYPAGNRPARWVVSNKSDGSVVRSSVPLPYVGMMQRSEEETFRQLGIALGKVSPDADTSYTAEHFDRDYLVKGTGKDYSGSYVRPDKIVVNRYHHPLLEGTDFWSTPQIKVPLLANNWAVRFGMLDPKMNPADNIFRGFLLAMEGPEVKFWVEPHDYRRDMNDPLFSDAPVFRAY